MFESPLEPVPLRIQVNIVPFGTIRITDSHHNEVGSSAGRYEEETAYSFPVGSVIGDLMVYEKTQVFTKLL